MATVDQLAGPTELQAPHEVLGIPAEERNAVLIVAAAARRLRALETAGGSETAVRQALAALIREARDAMLRAAAASA